MMKRTIIAIGLMVSIMPAATMYAAREFDVDMQPEDEKIMSDAARMLVSVDLELMIRNKRGELTELDRKQLDDGLIGTIKALGIPLEQRFSSLRTLLKSGANPNVKMYNAMMGRDDTPLTHLVNNYNGCAGLIRLLIRFGARDVDKALWFAVLSPMEDSESIAALLEGGANPNVRNVAGETLLMKVVQQGNTKMIEALLKHKADINAEDKQGMTALWHLAKQRKFPNCKRYDEISAMLVVAGARKDVVLPVKTVRAKLREEWGYNGHTPNFRGFKGKTISIAEFEDRTEHGHKYVDESESNEFFACMLCCK